MTERCAIRRFRVLRADKTATEVVREEHGTFGRAASPRTSRRRAPRRASRRGPAGDKNAVAGIVLTNPDKTLYPEAEVTKRDLALYYAAVGDWMLPHLRDRPLTLLRCPDGWNQECFYQKNAEDGVNEAISRVEIENSDGGVSLYMMADSVPAIVALLQMGVLELHPWGSRARRLGLPDRIIFDLDPDDAVGWEDLKQAALLVKTLLDNIGLAPFLKTTGGKGLHVVVPIEPDVGWEHVKGFTKAVAELLERTFPDRFTSKLLKISRRGKIFIDYLRNGEGATAVAPTRPAPARTRRYRRRLPGTSCRATCASITSTSETCPSGWPELKADPWRDIADAAVPLTPGRDGEGRLQAALERSELDEAIGGNERLLVQGMAGALLSGEASRRRDAALLRRALRDRRDQQHVLPHAGGIDARAMVGASARSFYFHPEGAETHHP